MKTQNNLLKRVAFPLAVFSTSAFTTLAVDGPSAPDLDGDGIPNIVDPDIDNDGLPNGFDPNVDGGIALFGPYKGQYIGDHLNNDNPAETDIDGDTQKDDSLGEIDIDGDSLNDNDDLEKDIDGDGRDDDFPSELDIDGDGKNDDDLDEDDIDGDGLDDNDDLNEDDIDGDGLKDDEDDDIDGDDRLNSSEFETDTDGDGLSNDDPLDTNDDGDNLEDRFDSDDDNDGEPDEDDIDHRPEDDEIEVEIELSRQSAAPSGSEVKVKIQRMAFGDTEFEIEAEDLPVGNYDIVIDGVVRGVLPVVQDGNDTEGEVEFETFPDKPDEMLLDFDVIGLPIEIRLNNVVYFSGTVPTPPDGPTGGGGNGGSNGPVNNGITLDGIEGLSWVFNDGGTPERLDFLTASSGQEVDLAENDIDSFSYTYQKVNDRFATIVVTFDAEKQDAYSLDFSNGTFIRQEFKEGGLDDTDSGTFGDAGNSTTPTDPNPGDNNGTPGPSDPVNNGVSPESVSGLSWTLDDGGTLERLDLLTASSGQEVDLVTSDIDPFTYTYQKDSDTTATIVVTFDAEKQDVYSLDFSNGTFARQEFKDSNLDDTDSGSFSQTGDSTNPSDPGSGDDNNGGGGTTGNPGPNDPVNQGLSPNSILGLNWTLNDGGTLERLDFFTASAGQEVDLANSDTDPFTYSYQVTSDTTATVVITFDAEKRDEYSVDFSNGTFVRQEFKEGLLDDTDSGTFTQG